LSVQTTNVSIASFRRSAHYIDREQTVAPNDSRDTIRIAGLTWTSYRGSVVQPLPRADREPRELGVAERPLAGEANDLVRRPGRDRHAMHRAAYAALGLDWTYEALERERGRRLAEPDRQARDRRPHRPGTSSASSMPSRSARPRRRPAAPRPRNPPYAR
jgi:hypothetical protein